MKKLEKLWTVLKTDKWIHYAILLIIGIILSIPLFDMMIRYTHDGFIHLQRISGDYRMLNQGQFPVMIIDNYCNGDGYNMNVFYSPLVTYIPLLIRLFTSTTVMALKLFGALCIILSGFTMYQLVYNVTKKRGIALIAGIIYLVAPYKLSNVYMRYAIGEFSALVFLPLVFLGLHNLIYEDGKKHYYIAIGAIGLLLCHNITTMYTAIFSFIYLILHIRKLQDNEVLKKIGINILFILLCSALYIVPMLEAKSYTRYGIFENYIMATNNEYASQQALDVIQFFKDTETSVNAVTFKIGIPTLILFLSTIYCARKVDKKLRKTYWIFIAFSLISLWMCTNLFPWEYVPIILCKIQYPWRMLGFFIFFSTPVCAINLYILVQRFIKKDWIKLLVCNIVLIILLLNTIPAYQGFYVNANKTQENLIADEKYEQIMTSGKPINHFMLNREYLPTAAVLKQDSYMLERKQKTYILEGEATISNENKNSLTMDITVQNGKKDTILEFPFIAYPGYEVIIKTNNSEQKLDAVASENGYLSVKLPEDVEQGEMHIEYKGSIITKVSYIVSAISVIIFIIYIIYQKRKIKKRIAKE